MSAKKTGGTAARKRAKDSAMAAEMKARKIERHTANCPICHRCVSVNKLYWHISSCKGSN